MTYKETPTQQETYPASNTAIAKAEKLRKQFFEENPELDTIFKECNTASEAEERIKGKAMEMIRKHEVALNYFNGVVSGAKYLDQLSWKELAAIRILDYIDNAGRAFEDLNLRGKTLISEPFGVLFLDHQKGTTQGNHYFYDDMIRLFRQFTGKDKRTIPSKENVLQWMENNPSGLDESIIEIRKENRNRILGILLQKIDSGEIKSERYRFEPGMTDDEKRSKLLEWWNEKNFHLKFAVRSPELLNEMLDNTLDEETMQVLHDAKKAGIPFFVNPYYLSLLNVHVPEFAKGADYAIRDYVLYSRELIDEFGHIVAWEKEDIVEPGKPNAAGWLLPSDHNIHRRYPEVAILIPDTMGRACGGLCVSCQRMYDFQSGNLNFNLNKLAPKESWIDKLKRLMEYYETDSQLRDILITGGDALMSSDRSLKLILDEVYNMALRKREANKTRDKDDKYAEMLRIRLGTRLPVYIPQRVTPELTSVLAEFKEKASKIGFRQFVIQTHFESPMEVTPEARQGIQRLLSAGWIVTNQLVFTAAASRRGHTAKLRKVLNDVGVMTYYTFTVKGYMENKHNFACNARSVQEQIEEKAFGEIPSEYNEEIKKFPETAENLISNIDSLRKKIDVPFLATDRNVLNLPGVGKSLTFRTIGITNDGRRILEFDHDKTRWHSPIIHKMGKVPIIESKTIGEYLEQLESMGENVADYETIYGYSIGETLDRMAVYEYPEYEFNLTEELTNFDID